MNNSTISDTKPASSSSSRPIKAALIDISGTLHVGQNAIPGAIAACQRLIQHQQQGNLKVSFLTNTSKMSSASLLQQLRDMGFDYFSIPNDGESIILTSVGATRRYLIERKLRPYCLVEDELVDTDFDGVDMEDPNCVLVGLAPSKFTYGRLNEAFRLLSRLKKSREDSEDNEERNHPLLIAIHRATHYRDADHKLSLGPGGFISLLEQSSGVSANVIGKPSSNFYQAAISSLGVDPSEAIMVGDDVIGDIKGALDAGIGRAILVKTGKYVSGDETGQKTGGVLPTRTVDSIVDAVDYICTTLK